MSIKSITSESVHHMKTIREKGGYEVWSAATGSQLGDHTWLTRMGAARDMEAQRLLYPNVDMFIAYVHYLKDPKG